METRATRFYPFLSFFGSGVSHVRITVGQTADVILEIAKQSRNTGFVACRKSAAPELGTVLSASPADDSPTDSESPEIKLYPRVD